MRSPLSPATIHDVTPCENIACRDALDSNVARLSGLLDHMVHHKPQFDVKMVVY
jgi:hypothetical protein